MASRFRRSAGVNAGGFLGTQRGMNGVICSIFGHGGEGLGEGLTVDLELVAVREGDDCESEGVGERENAVEDESEGLRRKGFSWDWTTPGLTQACSQASCAS